MSLKHEAIKVFTGIANDADFISEIAKLEIGESLSRKQFLRLRRMANLELRNIHPLQNRIVTGSFQ
jgi:hypothetical protein